jgi:hypothetical protein
VDGIRLEQVDALTSVCPGGIIGIHTVTQTNLVRCKTPPDHAGEPDMLGGVSSVFGEPDQLQTALNWHWGTPSRRSGAAARVRIPFIVISQSG